MQNYCDFKPGKTLMDFLVAVWSYDPGQSESLSHLMPPSSTDGKEI